MITIITEGRLLDCIGSEPVENASVVIEDGVIRDIYQGQGSIPGGAAVIQAGGRTILPGLIDAHSHFAVTTNDMGAVLFDPPFLTALRIRNQLELMLSAGFTTVRDAGGGHWSHRQAVEDGLIVGPRLLICGPMISETSGHGDFNVRGEMAFPPDVRFVNLMRLCDGPEDYRKAVREQFQLWADHIKICVTGGCASPNDEPWQIHLSEAEIRTTTAEAAAHGTYVMAHSLNDGGNRLAVECGVKTIEHACFLTEETAQLMKEKGTAVISTLAVVWWATEFGKEQNAAEWFLRKLANPGCSDDGASIMDGMVRAATVAKAAGVPVGSGADYFGTMIGGEAMNIKLLCDLAGFAPYEALKAATIVNAGILGIDDRVGSVEPNKVADLIIVNGNPDEDINTIVQSENIQLVMKDGLVLKNGIQ
jgi:imidazolonepropionase-like amidohydrolase